MQKLMPLFLLLMSLQVSAHMISDKEYKEQFKKYNACFILYDLNTHQIVSEYNPGNRCNERLSPDSTFKVPLSLMAFNQNIINQKTIFKWNGTKGVLPEHEQDQTPASWIKYSVLWVSQELTPQLGNARIKHYLAGFSYGNQDFSGDPGANNGLTHAWLSSSLKISAKEQLQFLSAMLSNELPVSQSAVEQTVDNMYLGTLTNGARYYGKTGSGRHGRNERLSNPSKLRDGWFEGFIEQGDQRYIFVSNLTDKKEPEAADKAFGSFLLKPIVMNLLNEYFS
jgi:beta-lactamase class D